MKLKEAIQRQASAGDRFRDAADVVMATSTSSARAVRDEAYREWQNARSAFALAIIAEQAAVAEIDAQMGLPPRWKERCRDG